MMLAYIIDCLGGIAAMLSGVERPESLYEKFLGIEEPKNEEYIAFDTAEEFIKQRYGGKTWQL